MAVYQVQIKPVPQMIHQTLSFQVILGSGNRIVKMPVRQLPYVLLLGCPQVCSMTVMSFIFSVILRVKLHNTQSMIELII